MPSLLSAYRKPIAHHFTDGEPTQVNFQLGKLIAGLFVFAILFTAPLPASQVGNSLELPPTYNTQELSVDELCDSFYEHLVEKSSYEHARQIGEILLQMGERNQDKDLQVRGLVRIAYVELYFGRWRNHWPNKIDRCEKLLGSLDAIHSVAKAEYLMFTGHMLGKWQENLQGGFQKIEESIWIANELGEDKLLVRATIFGAEILSYQQMNHRMLEYSYRAHKIATHTEHRSTTIAALNRLIYSMVLVGRADTSVPFCHQLLEMWASSEIATWGLELAGEQIGFEKKILARIDAELKRPDSPATNSRIARLFERVAVAAVEKCEREQASHYYLMSSIHHVKATAKQRAAETFFMGSILCIDDSNSAADVQKLIDNCPYENFTQKNQHSVTIISKAFQRVGAHDKAIEYLSKLKDIFLESNDDGWQQTEYAAEDYLNAYVNSKYQTKLIVEQTKKSQLAIWALTLFGAIGLAAVTVGITRHRLGRNQREELERQVNERTIELREVSEKAKLADNAKSEFVARVNHEIRNPLTAILAYCDLLYEGSQELGAQNSEFVSGIRASSGHLLELVNGVLDVSQIEKGEIATQAIEFHLEDTIQDVQQMLCENASDKNLSFGCEQEFPADCRLIGDETKLRQIMINLVSNAIKFTNHGSVELVVGVQSLGNIQEVTINVIDTGCGIPKDEQEKVFGQFSRASSNKNQPGNGLGLHITERLVNHLGGQISLTSRVGEGTHIVVTLPFDDNTIPRKTNATAKSQPSDNNIKILVVDDQEAIRETLCMQLNGFGYASRSCSKLDETLSLVGFWQPDLVMLDLRMPMHDGYEVLEKIREMPETKPVVVAMTGDATDTVRQKCEQAGFDYFLTKPFRISEVQEIVGDNAPQSQPSNREIDQQ